MKLGFFTMPVHPQGRPYVETLKEDREAFILADRLGYSEAYCGEHLTDACENIPNSMMFLTSLIDATRQIKLGTAVANLPFSHPVVVASNAAMLDNLLEGRLILGVGAGVLRSDAEALGLLDKDRGAMFVEAIDQVIALWTGEAPYNITGQFWNVTTAKTLSPALGVGIDRQALSEAPSPHRRHRDGSELAGHRRARPARLVAGHGELSPRQMGAQPLDQLRARRRRGGRASPIAPNGGSRARSSSPKTTRWPSVTAEPTPTAPIAST